ncbi:flagellar transcriptional regulator FlhD [Burkholderia sp. AU30198]|uniref:Flagellar transcriptional regulator FlhD n=1 Tax=Burkholderia aenigmatica TaxID=2015348 RepID=A0ABY6XYD7_9BURK|nr:MULTISPECIES: flagellar transcriptional regulator FlhD [Burkholderia]MCA8299550.1 flagellar transcriptional regulator FlhD [Burkholderia sp. AU30198]VWD04614.1 transcriptional regulator [Burkholderia aenigmatica]VWD07974.1 transcriptional regulator [Burkholderia aenigmatica]
MKVANDSDAMWELNMSYLWLAQRLLQSDRATGMFRLGVTADVAAALSMKHMNELASAGQLICALRPGRYGVLSALTRATPPVDLVRVHTAMVLAGLALPDEETS